MDDLVATVRLRERYGSAIGVCESPPLLEVGSSAAAVFERMRARLRQLIAPNENVAQTLLVIRDDSGEFSTARLRDDAPIPERKTMLESDGETASRQRTHLIHR